MLFHAVLYVKKRTIISCLYITMQLFILDFIVFYLFIVFLNFC